MLIAEVSRKFNITADTLRYYERVGLIPNITRTAGGIRNYSEDDCKWIEFIKCMRSAGLPIEVLIEYVELFQQGDTTVNARKEILIEQRESLIDRIHEMQQTLEKLNRKIDSYENVVVPIQKEIFDKKK